MRIPRDVGDRKLSGLLSKKFNYKITRQTGSHIRLTTTVKGEHHITIPRHKPLKVGTISGILRDIAIHLEIDKQTLIEELFGR